MKKPDITPAQVVALVQAVLALLIAFSLNITQEQSIAILGLSAIVAGFLFKADSDIRAARASTLAPQPQNITVLDPNAVNLALANTGQAQPRSVGAAGDTDVDDEGDLPGHGGRPPA
jgi:hypothetical protein